MGHDWDCPKNQVLPGSPMHKNQAFITFAIPVNIFYRMKFIFKCEILKSFITLGRLNYNFKINCTRGLVSVFYLIASIVD